MRIHAAGDSHVGRVRQGNEDAFWSGDSVFAVADGMGGHLAGEVASATALGPVAALDGHIFPDRDGAIDALRMAVQQANRAVAQRAIDEPAFRGMGTTLTASLVEGRRLHLAHIGDSRAYLLRRGEFSQVTDDHTLVQHLINEGQITKDEARTHPQRSIITRAIGVGSELTVDTVTLELEQGDVVLLCSDGLTGVVDDDRIAETLKRFPDLDEATETLIDLANEAGGPDNITVLLLRYDETSSGPASRSGGDTGELEEQQAPAPVRVDSSGNGSDGDWADRLGRMGHLGRDGPGRGDDDGDRAASSLRRWGAALLGGALVVALVVAGGRWLLSRSYYVGLEDDQVVIFQGVPTDVGPLSLSWPHDETELPVSDVADFFVDDLTSGLAAVDLADARRIVATIPRKVVTADANGDTTDTAPPTAPPSPTDATPSPTVTPGGP
jgi:serine/threonine protein phosphatase PrpC